MDQFKAIRGNYGEKRFFRMTTDIDFSGEKDLSMISDRPTALIDGANHRLLNLTLQHRFGYKNAGIFSRLIEDKNAPANDKPEKSQELQKKMNAYLEAAISEIPK